MEWKIDSRAKQSLEERLEKSKVLISKQALRPSVVMASYKLSYKLETQGCKIILLILLHWQH